MSVGDRSLVFSYEEFAQLVHRFAKIAPELLLQHPATAPSAFQLEQLQLTEALRTRFTVAVMGQMRVGKSTLLNALIGKALAPTGVTETTATVNWFRYGTGEQCNTFRVHWNDGSTQDLPLTQVNEWVGTAEHATRTRWIDFFADSDFLQTANIVDTPGTRSVLETHETATQGFLAEKLEAETFKYGGRAHAVIYAINPVGRAADRDLLALFGERTRLPGASAYNSIAVVQKWEHLGTDPLREIERKCVRLREQLQDHVAEVLPTSGLLAQAWRETPQDLWHLVARLATESQTEAVKELLLSPEYFCEERSGVVLDRHTRTDLYQRLGWPVLRFALQHAQARKIDAGTALRQAMWEASGIDKLWQVLQTRFFALAGLVQASTVLRKAWDPCNSALLQLRELAKGRQRDVELGRASTELLRERTKQDAPLMPVLRYVEQSLAAVEHESRQAEQLWRDLDTIKYEAEQNFRLLDADLASLAALEQSEDDELTTEERAELRRLFGAAGAELWARLGFSAPEEQRDKALERAWELHERWASRKARAASAVGKICEHAVNRLDMILDALEEQKHGKHGRD